MADKLKVFKNANVTNAASRSALSIPIYTTSGKERLAIKDVQLEITDLTGADAGFYKYPTTLQIDGVNQGAKVNLAGTNVASTPLLMTGSQIVDSESVVSLEIEGEDSLTDYGDADFMWVVRSSGKPTVGTFKLGSTNPNDVGAIALLDKVLANSADGSSTPGGYSGICFSSGSPLVKKFCYSNGSKLFILGKDGGTLKTHSWVQSCYGIGADDTYVYGKPSNATQYLERFNHVTMKAASNLTTSGTMPSYSTSNKGWVDVWDGHFYVRQDGSSTTTYKINLTTGASSTFGTPGNLAQSEYIGAVINTNIHGRTLLVQHGDQTVQVTDIGVGGTAQSYNQSSAFPTNPTTTQANTVGSLAAGIIWVNNGSYDASLIIDTNSMTATSNNYTQTLTTNTISIGGSTDVFCGGKHQGVNAKPRKMNYRVSASGVVAD